MTPSRVDETEVAIQRRARGTSGLDLFDAQLEAAPEVSRAEMPGAGQRARQKARERVGPTSAAKRHTLALLLEAHGPMTRSELAARTGWKKDSVNGRVAEARALPTNHEDRMVTDGHRGGESVVHLARRHSLTYAEG